MTLWNLESLYPKPFSPVHNAPEETKRPKLQMFRGRCGICGMNDLMGWWLALCHLFGASFGGGFLEDDLEVSLGSTMFFSHFGSFGGVNIGGLILVKYLFWESCVILVSRTFVRTKWKLRLPIVWIVWQVQRFLVDNMWPFATCGNYFTIDSSYYNRVY